MFERALVAVMFMAAVLSSAASAQSSPSVTRVRVLVLEPTGGTVEPALRTAVAGLVASELGRYEVLDVLAADDVRKAMELEADREAVGCGTDSCLAELAGALGARLVVFGDVAQLGTVAVLNLNLYDSERAVSAGRVTINAPSLGDLPARLPDGVAELVSRTLDEITPGSSSARAAVRGPAVMSERSATIVLDVMLVGAMLGGTLVGAAVWFAGILFSESANPESDDIALFSAPIMLAGLVGGAALGALVFEPAEPGWVALATSATALVGLAAFGSGFALSSSGVSKVGEAGVGVGNGLMVVGGVVAVVGPPIAAVWTANVLAE